MDREQTIWRWRPGLALGIVLLLGALVFFVWSNRFHDAQRPADSRDDRGGADARSTAAPAATGTAAQGSGPARDSLSAAQRAALPGSRNPSAVPEREIIASGWKDDPLPELSAFAKWVDEYLAASPAERAALVDAGRELAHARRTALAELIAQDPRRALAAAIPLAVRAQLPPAVVELLEKRVSAYGDLYRVSSYDGDPGTKPYFDYAKVGDDFYYAHRYGQRASLFELKSASLHGVAIDQQLAVVDSPVILAETGQTLEGLVINETCLYSGLTVTTIGEGEITGPESAPLEVGNQLIGLCSPAHGIYVENALRSLEASGQSSITTNGGLDVGALARYLQEPSPPLAVSAYGGTGGTGWPGQPSTNLTFGFKRAIVYRVQMQDWTPFPTNYTEAFCTNTILGNQCQICYGGQLSKTVSNQLYEFSWGKVVITQAVATPVLLLPKTRDQYTNDYWGPVLRDSMQAAAAAGFDTNVDFHVIVHSGLQAPNLNACAWGGGGAVWVNECWSVGVLVHEFGHVFGLPHANGWDVTDGNVWSPMRTHVEYDDLTDPMGQGNNSQKNHYNSFFKYFIHWYPESLVLNVTNSGTYRVYQFDDLGAPLTNTMALLIRHDPVSSYWVALRGNTTSGNFGNAAYIVEVQNNKNDTHLLDFNSPDANNSNGGLTVGQSYYDSTANLTLQNVAIGGTAPLRWMDFSVTLGETPELRAYYPLEGDVQDASGHNSHGTPNGGVSFVTGRVHAQAASFNGVDAYAEVPRSISNDFSIAFWVRTTATGGTGPWYNGLGLVDGSVAVQTNDFGVTLVGSKAAFGLGAPDTTIVSTASINNGQWHHVAATRNYSSGEMNLYVDGALQATATGPLTALDAAATLRIGSLGTGAGLLAGEIDDVQIYNYPLSVDRVAALAALPSAAHVAGQLYVDLHAQSAAFVLNIWSNQVPFGNFTRVGAPLLVANVGGTGIPGVSFNGSGDAYQGPNTVADLDGGSDRTIEVWAYNPVLASEETMVSWGHRGNTRRNLGFNFGSNGSFGAVTHWADDLGWGTPPPANGWHHLVYTYNNNVAQVYVDGLLRSSKTLGGALNTWPGEPINLGCQRDSAFGTRSFFYSGYLNSVRVHGGVLSPAQIFANYAYGMWAPSAAPGTPPGLTASVRDGQVRLSWGIAAGGASGYNVKRASVSGGPYTTIATGVSATSFADTNVNNGAAYYYVVSAANLFGQSADSSEVNVTAISTPRPIVAGTMYVDLRASDASAGSPSWLNQGTLGDFAEIGSPSLVLNVAGTGRPGVSFNGSTDAYLGPNTVDDLDGGSDRSIEVWAFNPSLASEETTVSWGHRGTTRRDLAFNFGNNGTWGAATHWGDDVAWGTVPSANAWHHLVYTYSNNLVSVYVDGALRNTKTLGGALNTFPGEAINLGCQREASGTRSLLFSGYLNAVRVHGGVLSAPQVLSNYLFGPWVPNSAPTLTPVSDQTIIAGATLTVTNVAADANSSQQTLTFSLLGAPVGATLDSANGVFVWRPLLAQANTTNPVTVKVVDNGFPILSATQNFSVVVVPPSPPLLGPPAFSNGALQFSVSGDAGPDYTVLGSTNLFDWTVLLTTNSPALPFQFQDPVATNWNQRFYRVILGP